MSKGLLPALVVAAVSVFGTGVAQAAAPANDAFAAATPISIGEEISGTNMGATGEPGEPNNGKASQSGACAAIADGPNCTTSVWYLFEPPSSAVYVVETCDMGTDFDTVLGIYTGATLATVEETTSNDDGGPGCPGSYGTYGSRIQFKAGPGSPHRFAVTGLGGEEGSFYIRLYAGEPKLRPLPDTRIVREASLVAAEVPGGNGVSSGSRHNASFPLASDAPGASYQCSLDGSAFTACTTPVSYPGLAPGTPHVFRTRAVAAGATDPTPAIERFTVDSTPPETTLVSGPSGALASQMATWVAAPGERLNSDGFACGFDGQPPAQPCGSKRAVKDLCQGHHALRIAAVDGAANLDPTPAAADVDVTTGPGCASPTIGPVEALTASPTRAPVKVPFDNKGAGATMQIEYGTTAAYGMELPPIGLDPAPPQTTTPTLRFLTPGTEYHYRARISTPFGSADSGDQTLTTKPLEGTLPVLRSNGAPTVGPLAASLPLTIDPQGEDTYYVLSIAHGGPVTGASPAISASIPIPDTAVGPQPIAFQVADLEPSTTYNYRFAAVHNGKGDSNEVLGPEGSFTTAAVPRVQASVRKNRFRLRRKQVRITKLRRNSKLLIAKAAGLPAKTKVTLKLTAGKSKQTARKKAKANGRVRFKVPLSKRIRKALRDRKVKVARIRVTAKPPGEPSSSVTFKMKLKP